MKLTPASRTSIRAELTALLAQATQRLSPAAKLDPAIIAARERARIAKAAVSAKRPTREVTEAEWLEGARAATALRETLREISAQRKAGRPPINDTAMSQHTISLTAEQSAWLNRDGKAGEALRRLIDAAME